VLRAEPGADVRLRQTRAMQRGPLDLPADEFGMLAARVVEEATRYLNQLDTLPVRPDSSGPETLKHFAVPPPETGQGLAVFEELTAVARHSRAGTGASSAT
jgi:hypothetical protein